MSETKHAACIDATSQISYFFALKSIGLSKIGGRKACSLLQALRHNRRTDQSEQGSRAHIDPSLSHLNRTIAGIMDAPDEVVKAARALMTGAGIYIKKLRKDYVQAIELLFSLPTGVIVDEAAYFMRCTEWVAQQFGVNNILSSDIHNDEGQPHCHVLILPLVQGKMAAKTLKTREKTAKLTESFWIEVAEPAGLKRPVKRLRGSSQVLTARAVIEKLQTSGDPVTLSKYWAAVRLALERDPQPIANAMGIPIEPLVPKKLKTMAQIFTSAGKGPKLETKGYLV